MITEAAMSKGGQNPPPCDGGVRRPAAPKGSGSSPAVLVFAVGQAVEIGPTDAPMTGMINGINIRGDCHVTYEVAWWNGRSHEEKWLACHEIRPVGEVSMRPIGFYAEGQR